MFAAVHGSGNGTTLKTFGAASNPSAVTGKRDARLRARQVDSMSVLDSQLTPAQCPLRSAQLMRCGWKIDILLGFSFVILGSPDVGSRARTPSIQSERRRRAARKTCCVVAWPVLPLIAHGQRQVQPELLCALQCVVDELQMEPTVGPSRAAPGKVLDDDLTIVLL
jgi:hypothetical protein